MRYLRLSLKVPFYSQFVMILVLILIAVPVLNQVSIVEDKSSAIVSADAPLNPKANMGARTIGIDGGVPVNRGLIPTDKSIEYSVKAVMKAGVPIISMANNDSANFVLAN